MSYYECYNCGVDWNSFPKVYVMLNSKINEHDNKFENKFTEFVEEVAKEHDVPANKVYQVTTKMYLGEVYKRYADWLLDTQAGSFCSVECATEAMKKREMKERVRLS